MKKNYSCRPPVYRLYLLTTGPTRYRATVLHESLQYTWPHSSKLAGANNVPGHTASTQMNGQQFTWPRRPTPTSGQIIYLASPSYTDEGLNKFITQQMSYQETGGTA